MAIPKVIHHCWFGEKPKPALIRECIESWQKLEGYRFLEWNQHNFPLADHPYTREMYQKGNYAFVSDFVRLKVLYDHGGIYLDSDVEVKKNFPPAVLDHEMIATFQYDCALSTAFIGSAKGNKTVGRVLQLYDDAAAITFPNNGMFTDFFLASFDEFRLDNRLQVIGDGIAIFPKEYFDCPSNHPEMGFAVHHAMVSWKGDGSAAGCKARISKTAISLAKKAALLLIGEYRYAQYMRSIYARNTDYYEIYLKHRKM